MIAVTIPERLASKKRARMNSIAATWQRMIGRRRSEAPPAQSAVSEPPDWTEAPLADIAPNDPIIAYCQGATGAFDIDTLDLDSPACRELKAAGVKLVVPLVIQGELIGLLNLGPRLSEQEYSTDDRRLLENLAAQAAPAVRVAQLVREQEAEARARERIEHELQVARLIQQNFLPKTLPELPGWSLTAYYRPAQEIAGDFYDAVPLANGKVAIVIGDVTDKGVPAALVMAATRTVLRAAAQQLLSPGQVLEQVNELMCPDTPQNMFVTCFFAVLDPATGHLCYANAGHDVPYVWSGGSVLELRVCGMPVGLMTGMKYEEKEAWLEPGQILCLHSDGTAEAHNPKGEMFGFPRLKRVIAGHPGGEGLIERLLAELKSFTGPDWQQEDDVTLLVLERAAPATTSRPSGRSEALRVLAEFSVPSETGNERIAIARVAEAVSDLELSPARLDRLKTAVAEATMNAIEHGNHNRAELSVMVRVGTASDVLSVWITDRGGGSRPIPDAPFVPNLEAKLAGMESPRGWGLFLIRNLVDEMEVASDDTHHTIELRLRLGDADAGGKGGAA